MASTARRSRASSRGRTQAERSAAARAVIVEATLACLRSRPLDELTLAEVAARAGVSKGLVHYHFETKERLLLAAQEAVFQTFFAAITAMTDDLDPSPERAAWGLDELWRELLATRTTVPIVLHLATQAVSKPAFREAFNDSAARTEALLADGIRIVLGPLESELEIPVETLARVMLAALVGLASQDWMRDDPEATQEAYEAFRSILLRIVPTELSQEEEEL